MIPNHGSKENSPSQETFLQVVTQLSRLFLCTDFRRSACPPLTQS